MSPHFRKKPNFQNGQKNRENRTNMDITLSFLSKPVDKHGITLVYYSYPPLRCRADIEMMKMVAGQEFWRVSQSIHRMQSVLMMNSLPHLAIPQMSVGKILFPEIPEKFILPIYSSPFSIIRNMTNKGQGRTVFNNCEWSLGPNMVSY